MKIRILAVTMLAAFLGSTVLSQSGSVIVSPEKITYRRSPNKLPEFKKSFEVTYPRFSGVKPEIIKSLGDSVSYWKLFETTLDENLTENFWLEKLDYTVTYNQHNILGIDLQLEGSGAYPDGSVKKLVLDLRTGRRVLINDIFTNIPGLLIKIDKEQQTELKKAKAESKKRGEDITSLITSSPYSVNRFEEFSVSDAGVVFYYDYNFPHAVRALQPDGTYFFSWADIKPHIKPGGLLSTFLK